MTQTSEFETINVSTNGALPPSPAAPGPRLPRREAWVDIGEEYPGLRVKVWLNHPRRLYLELVTVITTSGDLTAKLARLKELLPLLVLEHNGWCDPDGHPFPPATTPEFWEEIPDELAATIIALLQVESGKLASSVRTRNTR